MKTINLSDLDTSDIKYKVSSFPDGQQDIVINIPVGFKFSMENEFSGSKSVPILIQSRFNSFKDLELIICTTKALRKLGVKEIHLYIPYLLGARSDRHFQEGGNSYLVDIVAPIINAQNYESVTVIDAHSDVAAACIRNLKVEDNVDLVKWVYMNHILNIEGLVDVVLISPDAGALKKIYNVAEKIGYEGDVIVASKHRDIKTGQILSTDVPLLMDHENKDFIIIDDICDGGRTFIEIAKVIRQASLYNNSKIYLIVTHGIFSAGYEQLGKYFDGIYCTNSIQTIGDLAGNDQIKTNVKQLKVI